MKKITSIFAAAVLGVFAASAATPLADGLVRGQKYHITPEGRQMINTLNAKARIAMETGVTNGENVQTRQFIDNSGYIWMVQVLLSDMKICDMVKFEDPTTHQEVKYSFDQLPYYGAVYTITMNKPNAAEYSHYVQFQMCWPTYYNYEQLFTYTGEVDAQGQIPLEKRNYNPVSIDDMANNDEFTQTFTEANFIGFDRVEGEKKYEAWTMLENAMGDDMVALFDGNVASTYLMGDGDNRTGSKLIFQAYDKETNSVKVRNQIYLELTQSEVKRNIRNIYEGTGRIEGFSEINDELPLFGEMHLFNAGLASSEDFGDSNPFTDNWGPFSQFYVCIGDERVLWYMTPGAKKFSADVIQQAGIDVSEDENIDDHASMIMGYAFADPKYSMDPTIDPTGLVFNYKAPTYETLESGTDITLMVPEKNCFLMYGNEREPWSMDYGMIAYCRNFPESPNLGSAFGWGTTEGFRLEMNNMFRKTWIAKSEADIIYHYDPNDVEKTRRFSPVGSMKWEDSVETIAADNARVVAADGVITIVPAEDANVAVYALDGACVKDVNAAAGATVSVNAGHGVYVVVVNGASKKVAL